MSRQARSVARLAAVQALYQMEVSGVGAEAVVREFTDHRFDRDLDGHTLAQADEAYFGELVRGVVAEQADIDRAIVKRLAEGWRLERIDATLRAILRAGAAEGAQYRNNALRDYGVGAQILLDLGVREMVLLTSSQFKPAAMEGYGLKIVGRAPIPTGEE